MDHRKNVSYVDTAAIEQARWEHFFTVALQGTAAAWTGDALIASQNQIVEAVNTASCLADEALRVANERAELCRGKR